MSRPTSSFMTASNKRMRYTSPLKALLFAALSLGFSLCGFAENAYWTEFGNKPIYVEQINGRAKQTLKFLDYKNNMLVAELNIDGNVGEMSLPVNESMVSTLRFNIDEMNQVNQMTQRDNYVGAIKVLRPKAYPLIKFHQVPEMFTQIHSPILTLLDCLIINGDLDEANDLINRITLNKVSLKYSELAIRLMQQYLNTGNYAAAAKIARELPKDGIYLSNVSAIISAADALRGAGEFEAVIPLYQEIESTVPENMRKDIRMWLAYSLVLANRLDEATPMIDAMEEPAANERLFSLYKLLQGSRDHRNSNYGKALDVLTRGFVRAQTSYVWVPEMLFLIGDCYARANDPIAARNVWLEVTVLYPESPWADRAAESLKELPSQD